jgi:Ca2+-binding RTX toxin-like protein
MDDEIGTDTFINANYLRGSNFDDVLQMASSTQGVRFRGSAGNDTINGGTGDDRDHYISAERHHSRSDAWVQPGER